MFKPNVSVGRGTSWYSEGMKTHWVKSRFMMHLLHRPLLTGILDKVEVNVPVAVFLTNGNTEYPMNQFDVWDLILYIIYIYYICPNTNIDTCMTYIYTHIHLGYIYIHLYSKTLIQDDKLNFAHFDLRGIEDWALFRLARGHKEVVGLLLQSRAEHDQLSPGRRRCSSKHFCPGKNPTATGNRPVFYI
jgi:hypothetical protein